MRKNEMLPTREESILSFTCSLRLSSACCSGAALFSFHLPIIPVLFLPVGCQRVGVTEHLSLSLSAEWTQLLRVTQTYACSDNRTAEMIVHVCSSCECKVWFERKTKKRREIDREMSKGHRKCGRERRGAQTLAALLILSSVQLSPWPRSQAPLYECQLMCLCKCACQRPAHKFVYCICLQYCQRISSGVNLSILTTLWIFKRAHGAPHSLCISPADRTFGSFIHKRLWLLRGTHLHTQFFLPS